MTIEIDVPPIKPTSIPGEFEIDEWKAQFLFVPAQNFSLVAAKQLIEAEIKKQFGEFLAHRIKNQHNTILLPQSPKSI